MGQTVDITLAIEAITETIDAVASATAKGVPFLAVRDDTLTTLTPADGDWVPVRVNDKGAVHVTGGGGGSQFAEDSVHATTDLGNLILAVRSDVAASTAGSDGDYTGFLTDANGRLHVLDQNSLAIKTALELIDNAIAGSEMQVDVVTLPGTVQADIGAIKTAVQLIDNAISGSEMQVDVLTLPALATGTNEIGNVKNAGTFAVQEGNSAAMLTALQIMDDWDETNRAAVNLISGQVGVVGGTGVDAANVLRVSLATDIALPAGTNTIGKLAANDGVDVGDVSVNSLPGTVASDITAIKTATQLIDNAISGSEMQTDVITQPARDRATDNVGVALQTDVLMADTTVLTPKFAVINASTSGDNTLVAAVSAKKIRVLSYVIFAGAATTVRFESGAAGTALTGQMEVAANGGASVPFSPVGHFETAVNTLLNLELSAGNNLDGHLVYVEV